MDLITKAEVKNSIEGIDKFRSGVTLLQDFILSNVKKGIPGFFGKDPFPLTHTFVNGLYIRYLICPARALSTTQIHKQEHIFFILKGDCSILTEQGIQKVTAPYMGVTKRGTKRIIWSHNEVHWVTVHPLKKMSIEKAEKKIFAEDWEEIEEIEKQSDAKIKDFIDVVSKEE
jgi:hypothetical protein